MKIKHLAGAAILGLIAAPAFAIPLDAVSGSVQWKLFGLTTEFSSTAPGGAGHFGTNESTWGIGTITSLQQGGNPIWNSGEGGDVLNYIIYGIADQAIDLSTNPVNIYNWGATGVPVAANGKIHIDIYRTNGFYNFDNADLSLRTAYDAYNGISNAGTLYLRLELVPGVIPVDNPGTAWDESLTTLKQIVDGDTLPTSGEGFFYAEILGGTGMAKWNSNGFLGGAADFNGHYTLAETSCFDFPGSCSDFPGAVNDPIQSRALPEPTSLALLGLGLAGLALRRRKVA